MIRNTTCVTQIVTNKVIEVVEVDTSQIDSLSNLNPKQSDIMTCLNRLYHIRTIIHHRIILGVYKRFTPATAFLDTI